MKLTPEEIEELDKFAFNLLSLPDNMRLVAVDMVTSIGAHCQLDGDDEDYWKFTMGYLEGLRAAATDLSPPNQGAIMKLDPVAVAHSTRFRRVANGYPRAVALAYGGDIAAAAKDDDTTVAERVRQWEISEGIEPRDWIAIGREEMGSPEEQLEDEATIAKLFGQTLGQH